MLESTEQAAADRELRAQLLAEARRQYQLGAVAQAWEACAQVAELSRLADDAHTGGWLQLSSERSPTQP